MANDNLLSGKLIVFLELLVLELPVRSLKVRNWRNEIGIIGLFAVSDEIAVIKVGLNGGLANFRLNPWIFLACRTMAKGNLVL